MLRRTLARAVMSVSVLSPVAGAQTQSFQAWSDALPLPAVSDVRSELELAQQFACGVTRSAADTLRDYEAKLAAEPVDSPLRAAYETILPSLRAAAAKEKAAPPVPAGTGPKSLGDALKSARAWLQSNEPAGLKAFQASEDARDAKKAKAAALAASLAGRPSAAMAALLVAAEKNPGDSEALVNLGGALALLGQAREALVVLDAAAKVGYPKDAALGWPTQAVALNNKGFALQTLGQTAAAEAALRQAVQAAPALAEARANLSRTLACAGKLDEAVKFARAGVRRSAQLTQPATPAKPGEPATPPVEINDEDDPLGVEETTRPSTWVFDVSRGAGMSFPNLKLPQTPADAVALQPVYQALYEDLTLRQAHLQRQADSVQQALRQAEENLPPVMRARRHALTSAVYRADREPRVAGLWRNARKVGEDVNRIWTTFWHCEGDCGIDRFITQAGQSGNYTEALRNLCIPALDAKNATWRSAMQLYGTDLAKATEAEYRLQTGLAANSSDAQFHAWASLQAEFTAVSGFAELVHAALAWSTDIEKFEDGCVKGPSTAAPGPVAGPLTTEKAPLCSPLEQKLGLSLSLKVIQIEATCDRASLKLNTPGWIAAFGKLEKRFGKGGLTVSAGAEAGAEIPFTSLGVKAAGGFYVTLDSNMEFADVGTLAEAKASASAKAGPLKIGESVKGVSGRWSLIATP